MNTQRTRRYTAVEKLSALAHVMKPAPGRTAPPCPTQIWHLAADEVVLHVANAAAVRMWLDVMVGTEVVDLAWSASQQVSFVQAAGRLRKLDGVRVRVCAYDARLLDAPPPQDEESVLPVEAFCAAIDAARLASAS